MTATWHVLVLAAGRGADDPMAKACNVSHKAALPVAGIPMLARVVAALRASRGSASITICCEHRGIIDAVLGPDAAGLAFAPSRESAPASVLAALDAMPGYPVLVTTADHALLTPAMIEYFCAKAGGNSADISVGLAKAETIFAAYPQSVRTFFRLGPDRVSGCNLFALANGRSRLLVERWQELDRQRKKPWKLVSAFGPVALIRFALGWVNVDSAFDLVSKRLGVVARPVLMPFAEAAIDVDKPSDLEMAETILAKRKAGA